MVGSVPGERLQVGCTHIGSNSVGVILCFQEWADNPCTVGGELLCRIGIARCRIPFEIPSVSRECHRYAAVCNSWRKTFGPHQGDQIVAGFNGLGLESRPDCLVEVFDPVRFRAPPFAEVGRPEVLGIERILPTIHVVDQADQAGEAEKVGCATVRTEFLGRPIDGQGQQKVGIPALLFPVQHDECRHAMSRYSCQIMSHHHVADIPHSWRFGRA